MKPAEIMPERQTATHSTDANAGGVTGDAHSATVSGNASSAERDPNLKEQGACPNAREWPHFAVSLCHNLLVPPSRVKDQRSRGAKSIMATH